MAPTVGWGRKWLGEMPFCWLTNISECNFTYRNFSSTSKAMMKPVPYFINTDGQTFGSRAGSVFRKFGEMLLYYYYWIFPRCILLSKVWTKYCACVINTANVLTWTRPVETPSGFNFQPALKNVQIKSQGRGSQQLESIILKMNNIFSTNAIAIVLFVHLLS